MNWTPGERELRGEWTPLAAGEYRFTLREHRSRSWSVSIERRSGERYTLKRCAGVKAPQERWESSFAAEQAVDAVIAATRESGELIEETACGVLVYDSN